MRIAYGKNLTDVKQDESIENTITGVYPYWKDSDGNIVELPEKTVSAESAKNYPFRRTVPMDFSSDFADKPTIAQLKQRAEKYISDNNIGIPKVNITVSFQPLWQTEEYKNVAALERIGLCDTVTVEYEKLGVSAKAKVNKTVYDVLKDKYSSIELGEARSNLSDKIINQEKQIEEKPDVSFLQQAIESATNLITGNKGGYIVYMYDGDGKPYEMLVMDTPDILTAQNVWRFNQAGFGHSSTGYDGPYTTAITQDGKIVADFVATGTLAANLIKTGILSDHKGINFWNMDTGEFELSSRATVGGKTVEDIAQEQSEEAVNAQTQGDIFNKLTDNGKIKGIYMKDGQLYINASYLAAGILSDASGKNTWNLDTGKMIMENLHILGGEINIDSPDSNRSIISLTSASWGASIKLTPGGLYYERDNADGTKTFWSFGNNGIESGVKYENRTKVNFYIHNRIEDIYEMNANGYPSFEFTSADGKKIRVVRGMIYEQS